MRYWHARVYTPFCGEEADVYIQAENQEQAMFKAREAACENGMEWFEAPDWCEDYADLDDAVEDYYAQCGVSYLDAITKDEYKYREKEGEWMI